MKFEKLECSSGVSFIVALSTLLTCVIPSAAQTNCETIFSNNRSEIQLLQRAATGYVGYELLRRNPVFVQPNEVRNLINETWPSYPDRGWHVNGQLVTAPGSFEFQLSRVTTKDSALQIFHDRFAGYIPEAYLVEIKKYVSGVWDDAVRREHKFKVLIILLRTELSRFNQLDGHSHNNQGSLTYAVAPIGLNTEVGVRIRSEPQEIQDYDYISSQYPDQTIVFGNIWHRTPPRALMAPRLWLAVELLP